MIKIYARSRCTGSIATKRYLENHSVDYEYIRVDKDDSALAHIHSLGYRSTPVVVTEDLHWPGFKPELLATLIGGDTIPETDAERVDISIDDEFGDLDENGY